MPHPSKRPPASGTPHAFPPGSVLAFLADRSQLDFELEFCSKLLEAVPDHVDVLQVHAANLTTKGRLLDGLAVDKQLVTLRPTDPTSHYNLACRYALLHQPEQAFASLRRAMDLGYDDVEFMDEDPDLDSIRTDPRFRQLMRECRSRA